LSTVLAEEVGTGPVIGAGDGVDGLGEDERRGGEGGGIASEVMRRPDEISLIQHKKRREDEE
jgi:hypothetical protein